MKSGTIGRFQWVEAVPKEGKELIDAMLALKDHLIGLRAVNVSWDSGLLIPSAEEQQQGWTLEQGRAVSPVLDDSVIDNWPYEGWDEWYFFSALPTDLNLFAFCNYGGLSIAKWPSLVNMANGFDLQKQLEAAQPTLVLGEGETLFAISAKLPLIEDFGGFVEET